MESGALSPIVVIKQKEIELANQLAATKQAAEQEVLAARQWTVQYRDQAEKEEKAEAAVFYRTELAAIDAEANRLHTEGERMAAQVLDHGTEAFEQAVALILSTVLPRGPENSCIGDLSESR